MNPLFKTTIKGTLDFGAQKPYEMMMAHFQKRLESYYKNDMLLKNPCYFSTEKFVISVPRTLFNCSEKTWKNTVALLRELRSFAVAGALYIWVTDEKGAVVYCDEVIEPQGDKLATSEYLRGLESIEQNNDDAAIECFTKAIEKYPSYAQAYERRGYAYIRVGRYEDARMDFAKCISINPIPEAFFSRAELSIRVGNLRTAVEDLQRAIDNAVPFQPIFWQARRVKGECHYKLDELKEAQFELKFFTKRVFRENDPNIPFRKQAWMLYADVLTQLGQKSEAAMAMAEAQSIESPAQVSDLLMDYRKTTSKMVPVTAS